jgi:hypothetical protein
MLIYSTERPRRLVLTISKQIELARLTGKDSRSRYFDRARLTYWPYSRQQSQGNSDEVFIRVAADL